MSRGTDQATLAGGDGPVEVVRDRHGVLRVDARSAADALLGLGYCHGVDRRLQMLFVRILGRGELCRHLDDSDKSLAIDTFFRRLDLRSDVASEYARLSERDRRAVDAYCRGVNLAVEAFGIPWELKLLGYRPVEDPWSFDDVVVTAKLMGYVGLAATQGEVERWIVECVKGGVDTALLEELFPGRLGDLDVDLIRSTTVEPHVVPKEIWELGAAPKGAASNNWTVSGAKTASGKPLLCNDPHLEVNRLPAVFFESFLRWRDAGGSPRYTIGASVPGTPGVVAGRNRDLAWSVTYAYMDAIDSWVEECRDGKARRGDDWVDLRVRTEVIRRKKNPDATLRFHETAEHGTIEGDPTKPGRYLATRWSNRDGTSAGAVGALVEILEAKDVEVGRRLLGNLSNSAWCFVLADRAGSIAFQMSGKMPIRRAGSSGLCPLPGWDPDNDWKGFAAAEDLPRDLNPPNGVLATANDDLNHLGRLKPINLPLVPYRAERIREVLAGPGPFTVESMKALQYDLTSTQARRFLEILRPILAEFAPNANARTLAEWDAVYRADSPAPTLFELFYRTLVESLFRSGLGGRGGAMAEHLFEKTTFLNEYYAVFDRVLLVETSLWFGGRTRAELFRAAVEASGLLSAGPKNWAEVERVPVRNILFGGKLPAWLGFDGPTFSLPGGRATVVQGQISNALGYPSATGPSIHLIADLSNDEIHSNLPGGPSDRRFSPWYRSDLSHWLNGVYKTFDGRGSDVNAGQVR